MNKSINNSIRAGARSADTVIVLDFETSGLSPDVGDRAIEIGAVRIERGRVTDRFQSLMRSGRPINAFIEDYTGITNAMLREAPPSDQVMWRFAEFAEDFDLVAHNAAFDRRFLDAELGRVRRQRGGEFACTMLVARRLYPEAPNHRLGTLVRYHRLQHDGIFHRALADAEMTARLWLRMLEDIRTRHPVAEIPFGLMQAVGRQPKAAAAGFLERWAGAVV